MTEASPHTEPAAPFVPPFEPVLVHLTSVLLAGLCALALWLLPTHAGACARDAPEPSAATRPAE